MHRINAIYARQSVDRTDSISIESQIEFCIYETRGETYEVFADRGFSGKNTHRPELQRMLRQIKRGHIRRVICYKLDRCSRSILDFTTFMEFLRSYDVEFVSCTEKFDTGSPMGRAMLSICIVFAQLERETIQQRVYDAYHARCKQGFYMGGRIPFGFRLTEHTIADKHTSCYEPLVPEAEILTMLFESYAKPEYSLADVVRDMEIRKIKNPRRLDGLWIRSHIGRILRNPIYVKADMDIYNYFMAQNIPIYNPPSDFVGINGCYLYTDKVENTKLLVLAPHHGIIDAPIWLDCQRKGRNNQLYRSGSVKYSWLSGRMQCGKCGYAMIVRHRASGPYLVCSMRRESQRYCGGVSKIGLQRVEEQILPRLKLLLSETELLHRQKVSFSSGKSIPSSPITPINIEDNVDILSGWDMLPLAGKRQIAALLIKNVRVGDDKIEVNWFL